MGNKFDKFAESSREALKNALKEARRLNHNYIGTEHLLLGILRVGDSNAGQALQNLGINLLKVRSAVEFIIGRGESMIMGEIGLTPRAKKVIELSVEEAQKLNQAYISIEHLLLGLLREGEGIGAGVLESLGVRLEKAQNEVLRLTNQNTTDSSTAAPISLEDLVHDLNEAEWPRPSISLINEQEGQSESNT